MTQTTAVERYAKLKDGNVFYLKQGQGHPLVILHPVGQSSWVWHKVLDSLSEHFQCYVLDMPGFARSDLPTYPYSIERFSEAIVEFMDNVGIAKAHLMGQRTGAMVSFNLTASYPERVDKLVLVSCPAWTKEEGQVVYEGFMQPMHEHGVLQIQSFERMAAREPYVDRMWTENEEEVVRVRGGWCAATQRANTSFAMADTERAGRIKAPTLIVYGEYDVLRKKDRLHAIIPGSTLKMFPDCGMPNYETPAPFAKEVTSFLLD